MAQGKKSFILYSDQRGIFEKLTDEQAGKLIKHIYGYVNDENPESDFITELAFESIKTQLKRDLKSWEAEKIQRSEAGRKGGLARARNAKRSQAPLSTAKRSQANQADNVNVSDNDSVSVSEKDSVRVNETPPKKAQVLEFFQLRSQSSIEANQFFDYWQASNWQNNLGANVNWQQKAISWISRVDKKKQEAQVSDPYKKQQLKY